MFKADKSLVQEIDNWIEKNKEAYVKDLARIVSIPSVSEQTEGKYPFGEKCREVLDEMIFLASNYGFHMDNHEYYCGSILIPGNKKGAKKIGMYAHLDVVPLGEGWYNIPLGCSEKDGFLIGRDVGDNKGPGICALYTLRFLKEHNIQLNNDLLVYYGCSEETGMQDIEYFCRTQKVPDVNLVLDTNFPVCYGEKGLVRAKLTCKTEGNLSALYAGSVVNVIPAKAEAVIKDTELKDVDELLKSMQGVYAFQDGKDVRIVSEGISKHAAFPEGSLNAIYVLSDALEKSGILEGNVREVIGAVKDMTADSYGVGCGIPFEDKESGKLTCVGSILCIENGTLQFQFDIRYPVTVDGDMVIKEFSKKAESLGFEVEIKEFSKPAYVPPDNPYIYMLNEISDFVQGKHYEPYTMGGGTYARHLPCAVGFGPGVPDAPNLYENGHGQGHQPDECILADLLFKGIKTYIIAILELDKML